MMLALLGGIIALSLIGRADAQPSEEWSKTIGGWDWDYSYSVQQTDDGGYIIVGYTESFGAGAEDVYLLRLMLMDVKFGEEPSVVQMRIMAILYSRQQMAAT